MVVKGFNDIVGVQWFQDDSGVLYSHQNYNQINNELYNTDVFLDQHS